MTADQRLTVGLDARVLAKSEPTGVARYTRALVRAVARTGAVRYVLFGVEDVPDALTDCDGVVTAGVPAPAASGLRAHLWEQARLPLALEAFDLDLMHAPAGLPPLATRVPLVTTVHDLSPLDHPEWFSRRYATLYRLFTPVVVRRSARVIAVSRTTRRAVVDRYPSARDRTVAVHNGVRPPESDSDPSVAAATSVPMALDQETTRAVTADAGFLLFVGAHSPRKNLRRALLAYRLHRERSPDPPAFVLVGPDRDILASPDLPSVSGVHSPGYVAEDALGALYRRAAALVYPSLYEGFGLPILEAMRVGTPVVTSDRGAPAEVAGDAAVLVDPESVRSIATGLRRALAPDIADRLATAGRARAATFTWDCTARRTVAVYHSAVGERTDAAADPGIDLGSDPTLDAPSDAGR